MQLERSLIGFSAFIRAPYRPLLAAGTAATPLLVGGAVLDAGIATLDLPILGALKISSVLAFDTGVYLAVVGMVLMAFEAFGDHPTEATP